MLYRGIRIEVIAGVKWAVLDAEGETIHVASTYVQATAWVDKYLRALDRTKAS